MGVFWDGFFSFVVVVFFFFFNVMKKEGLEEGEQEKTAISYFESCPVSVLGV